VLPALCALANQTDRVTVEEFVTASMVEQDREQTSDFCAAALSQRKPPQTMTLLPLFLLREAIP